MSGTKSMEPHWILEAVGNDRIDAARAESARRRLAAVFGEGGHETAADDELEQVLDGFELVIFDLLSSKDHQGTALRETAAAAFQILRVLPTPESPVDAQEHQVRLACLGTLGDRWTDARRILKENRLSVSTTDKEWGRRVRTVTYSIWLRLLRKDGWQDLGEIAELIKQLREEQLQREPDYLAQAESKAWGWELVAEYHLARAAEILAVFSGEGAYEEDFDIGPRLEAHFDRAISAASQGGWPELENRARLWQRTAEILVENSIWTVTRAVNSRVSRFVRDLVSTEKRSPVFELLPPQRATLREQGLLGSAHRSMVVSLPTSSGKTLIAKFRILQAINQFDEESGWVAYLAPTRALVHQVTLDLRRSFAPLGLTVERVSPALEVDGLESRLLEAPSDGQPFRVLVSTPEKMDLLLRSGLESRLGRPLTLVVVDEAHNLSSSERGIKLELLLATINRECRHAQFLLLTPFIENAKEIASWLDSQSSGDFQLRLDWSPNDRAVVMVQAVQGGGRGPFKLDLRTVHTSQGTLDMPTRHVTEEKRFLDLTWSKVKNNKGKLAAVTADLLGRRGTMVVLVGTTKNTWSVAETLRAGSHSASASEDPDIALVRRFVEREMGSDFPLSPLLGDRIAVHHAGLPDEVRTLVEWLTGRGALAHVVATTTLAQGVNFPFTGVVFAAHKYPFGQKMPPEDFWNIAGRAGRVGQTDLGLVGLVARSPDEAQELDEFVKENVRHLNSSLVEMVAQALELGKSLTELNELFFLPAWSSFLQYLAHTYRQIGDPRRFADQIEIILRGTLGYRHLRRQDRVQAEALTEGVRRYAGRLADKSLSLVDLTGLSWESVGIALSSLRKESIEEGDWSRDLFKAGRPTLRRMFRILSKIPELRGALTEPTTGEVDSDRLSYVVSDWVNGRALYEIAQEYFHTPKSTLDGDLTRCCKALFGQTVQTTSWGLSALQTLTLGRDDQQLDEPSTSVRHIPGLVYYGVADDEAVRLRMIGVPRSAAPALAGAGAVDPGTSLSQTRISLDAAGQAPWVRALGHQGADLHRVWRILEGFE